MENATNEVATLSEKKYYLTLNIFLGGEGL